MRRDNLICGAIILYEGNLIIVNKKILNKMIR